MTNFDINLLKTYAEVFILISFVMCGIVLSQTVTKKNRPQRFSSVYTDLRKDCRDAWNGRDRQEALARGQDIPQRCKGFGGYFAHISYSAMEEYLAIGKNGDAENLIMLRPKDSYLIEQAGSRLEWRLANGRPFAVIVRYVHYDFDAEKTESPFDTRNKTGESLIIKGLRGFEQIDFQLDAKTPEANRIARDMADAAYRKVL